MGIQVFHIDRDYKELPLVKGSYARAVIGPWVGAKHATFNYVVMQPGQENVPHVHAKSEDVIFLLQGNAIVTDLDARKDYPISPGNVVLIDAGTWHTVTVTGNVPYIGCGGPVPHDLDFYRNAGLIK